MQNHVKTLFNSLQTQLYFSLQSNRAALTNSVAKGDATEDEWLNLLKNHLPYRYQADRAFVIDSDGAQSGQIDVVIYDRQYTPLLFNRNQEKFVPAESVYAVFEVKQELNLEHVRYTGNKIASVRNLKRTSAQIISVGKGVRARSITPILGGILTSESSWNPPFGESFEKAITLADVSQRIDLGIALKDSSFDISYVAGGIERKTEIGEATLLYFFFNLLRRLQQIGTVPAIDYNEYLKIIDALN